jgi:hypothetical protein
MVGSPLIGVKSYETAGARESSGGGIGDLEALELPGSETLNPRIALT